MTHHDSLFHVWEITCGKCAAGVFLTGCSILQADKLTCPVCKMELDTALVKNAVRAATVLESVQYALLTKNIMLIPPRRELPRLGMNLERVERFGQTELAMGSLTLPDEDVVEMSKCRASEICWEEEGQYPRRPGQ